jgi:hypothetical protein
VSESREGGLVQDRDKLRAVVITVMNVQLQALLGYYAAYSGNSLLTFRDNLSLPYSRLSF